MGTTCSMDASTPTTHHHAFSIAAGTSDPSSLEVTGADAASRAVSPRHSIPTQRSNDDLFRQPYSYFPDQHVVGEQHLQQHPTTRRLVAADTPLRAASKTTTTSGDGDASAAILMLAHHGQAAASTNRASTNSSHPANRFATESERGDDADDVTHALRLMLPGSNNVSAFDDGDLRTAQYRGGGVSPSNQSRNHKHHITTTTHATAISTPTPRRGRQHRGYPIASPMNVTTTPKQQQSRNPLTVPPASCPTTTVPATTTATVFEPKWTNRAFAKATATTPSRFASVLSPMSTSNYHTTTTAGPFCQQHHGVVPAPDDDDTCVAPSSIESDGLVSPPCSGRPTGALPPFGSDEDCYEAGAPRANNNRQRSFPIALTLATFAVRH